MVMGAGARGGLLARRAQAKLCKLLRSDTPKYRRPMCPPRRTLRLELTSVKRTDARRVRANCEEGDTCWERSAPTLIDLPQPPFGSTRIITGWECSRKEPKPSEDRHPRSR